MESQIAMRNEEFSFNPSKVILQNMFKYCDIFECFQNFRLVNETWKQSLETARFEKPNTFEIFRHIYTSFEDLETPSSTVPIVYSKILRTVQHFHMEIGLDDIEYGPITDDEYLAVFLQENFNLFANLALENCRNLLTSSFSNVCYNETVPDFYHEFMQSLLVRSRKTLTEIDIPDFIFPNVPFPKMEKIHLHAGFADSKEEFDPKLKQCLKNMKRLEVIHMPAWSPGFIAENYPQHCVTGVLGSAETVPVKITGISYRTRAKDLDEIKFPGEIQYIAIGCWYQYRADSFWENYEENLCKFPNLKGVLLYREGPGFGPYYHTKESLTKHWYGTEPGSFERWMERIEHIESLGIENFNSGDELDAVKKEMFQRLPWRFQFGSDRFNGYRYL